MLGIPSGTIFLLLIAVVTGQNYEWLWAMGGQSVCNNTAMAGITSQNVSVYVGRVHERSNLFPAYINPSEDWDPAVYVDATNNTRTAETYEVLCGDGFGWFTVSNLDGINATDLALPVGYHSNGDVIYACRFIVEAQYQTSAEFVSGVADKDLKACTIPVSSYSGYWEVHESAIFEVLIGSHRYSNDLITNSSFSWEWSRDGDDSPCSKYETLLGGVQGPLTVSLGRVHHFSELVPAYIKKGVHKSAFYSVGDKVYQTDDFEVLCGTELLWQPIAIDGNHGNRTLPAQALPAGYTSHGDNLYICRAISALEGRYPDQPDGQFMPGLVDPESLLCNTTGPASREGGFIVLQNSTYEILVYANQTN